MAVAKAPPPSGLSQSTLLGIIFIVLAVLIVGVIIILVVHYRRRRRFRRKPLHRPKTDDTLEFLEPRSRDSAIEVDSDEEWGNVGEIPKSAKPTKVTAAQSPYPPPPPVPAKESHARHGPHDNEDPEGEEDYDPLGYYIDNSASKPGHERDISQERRGEYEDEDDHPHTPLLSPSDAPLQQKTGIKLGRLPPLSIPLPRKPTKRSSKAPKNNTASARKDSVPPTPSPTSAYSLPSAAFSLSNFPLVPPLPVPPVPPLPPTENGDANLQRATTQVVAKLLKTRAANVGGAAGGGTDANNDDENKEVEHIERPGSIINYSKTLKVRRRELPTLPPMKEMKSEVIEEEA